MSLHNDTDGGLKHKDVCKESATRVASHAKHLEPGRWSARYAVFGQGLGLCTPSACSAPVISSSRACPARACIGRPSCIGVAM